jgi:hypothetical protein
MEPTSCTRVFRQPHRTLSISKTDKYPLGSLTRVAGSFVKGDPGDTSYVVGDAGGVGRIFDVCAFK